MAPTIQDLIVRLKKLEALVTNLFKHISIVDGELNGLKGPHIIFTGVNVHIVSGAGNTDEGTKGSPGKSLTGLGNLVIGYNEPRINEGDIVDLTGRGGSHNLIVGPMHKYSSYGGFVAGEQNTVNSNSASVCGGAVNTASGQFSSVCGGYANTASGYYSAVSGGSNNTASGVYSSVSGGESNTASGGVSSVSGGSYNIASSGGTSVGGGNNNTASGNGSSVSGGASVTENSTDGWAAGAYHTP